MLFQLYFYSLLGGGFALLFASMIIPMSSSYRRLALSSLAKIVYYFNPQIQLPKKQVVLSDIQYPCIILANHRSALDPLTFPVIFDDNIMYKMIFMAKDSLFRVPLSGSYLSKCEHIPVHRNRHPKVDNYRITKVVDDKNILLIYPEGTRNKTDNLLPFKEGAFKIAKDHNLPIYLLAVKNVDKIPKPTTIQYEFKQFTGNGSEEARLEMSEMMKTMS